MSLSAISFLQRVREALLGSLRHAAPIPARRHKRSRRGKPSEVTFRAKLSRASTARARCHVQRTNVLDRFMCADAIVCYGVSAPKLPCVHCSCRLWGCSMNSHNLAALVREFRGRTSTAMTKPQDQPTPQDQPKLSPGDVAEPGTPGTGEDVCPECKGTGQVGSAPCATCGGTGKVTEGIGGG